VQYILADVLAVPKEEISNDTTPDTIQTWDSLQHLNFVLAVEQAFNVNFKPEEVEQLTSVKAMIEMLENKLGTGSS
jgi:acyl carrier protein